MPPEKDIFRVFLVVSCIIISVVKNNQIEKYFCRKLHLNLGEVQKKFYLHISNIFVKNKNPKKPYWRLYVVEALGFGSQRLKLTLFDEIFCMVTHISKYYF